MAALAEREVATLWVGGRLSWLEQLCLRSFVDRGQRITLYTYHPVAGVPQGVAVRDGREILSGGAFLRYEARDSLALFADRFRLHLLRARPGVIWVDADVYCLRPVYDADDIVMGFEAPDSIRLSTSVVALPPDHPALLAMLDLMDRDDAIPPFLSPQVRKEFVAAARAGTPVPRTGYPWGVWGPRMLTWVVRDHALHRRVQPAERFCPVAFADRALLLGRRQGVEARLTPKTSTIHLWSAIRRDLAMDHNGLPPKGSYLEHLVKKHRIDAPAAPIPTRRDRPHDASLADRINLPAVSRIADIGGRALGLCIEAHRRWGAAVDLVDVDGKGRFQEVPSPWVAPAIATLTAAGLPEAMIRRIGWATDARPAEIVANLAGFGDAYKAAALPGLLDLLLAPGGRLVSDIRRGSGAFPMLKPRGTLTELSAREDQGTTVTRILLAARPALALVAEPAPEAGGPDEPWDQLARRLAGPEGFVRDGGEHSMLFVPRDSRTLVVTFDNLDIAMEKREDRRPWGYSFIEKQGWSMLGVMAGGWTWFRDPWVTAQFDDLADSGFFARFDRVVFYGASMGGYGAAAFVPACPGADVVAISPQSTLDRALTPWETRYTTAWGRDFSGPYGDAAAVSAAAGRVILLYDPHEPLDSQHVARFTAANVMKLRAPMMGHRLGSSLQQMGILTPVILAALDGTLTEAEFYRQLRARKTFPRYQRELFDRAVRRGHTALARRMGRWVLTRGDNRHIRKAMADL
jgi:hypothetical protein